MTAIAAIQTPDSVLMGGDSAQRTDGSIMLVSQPKVFINGDYCFGVAGSPRLAEIVEFEFRPPGKIQSMTWPAFLARSFVPKLKDRLGGEIGTIEKSAILVGTKGGGIFEIDRQWFVKQSRAPYAAIGSGADWALGSFFSSRGNPRRRLLKALKAAAHFNAFVRPPFVVVELRQERLEEELWGSVEELTDPSALFEVDQGDRGFADDVSRDTDGTSWD